MLKAKFIPWKELNKDGQHQYKRDLPLGQQWGVTLRHGYGTSRIGGYYVTNRRGEGFVLHGSTKDKSLCALIDALNKRDFQIAGERKVQKRHKRKT